MSSQQSASLIEAVRGLADKARRYQEQFRDRGLGEEDTKAALITPLLEALGWNVRDPEEVHHEYRPTTRDNPVDYCLRLQGTPKLLVEAKGFGEDLSEQRWLRQTLSYATMAGVEWCVLTNGNEYRLYNAAAAVVAEERLFCKVRLSDGHVEEAVRFLSLISRSNMSGTLLNRSWERYHTDRRVKDALRDIVDTADRRLVLLIRRRATDLSPKEIAASIRRWAHRGRAEGQPCECAGGRGAWRWSPQWAVPLILPGEGGRVDVFSETIRPGREGPLPLHSRPEPAAVAEHQVSSSFPRPRDRHLEPTPGS
jgi:predicted type IV restriction endonuclease